MRLHRVLSIVGVAALIGTAAVIAAPAASADQTWQQSVGRASADAPCPANSAADALAGWSEWIASWEYWPNNGKGGYVCTRANTWAYESTATAGSSGLCLLVETGRYFNFIDGWMVPAGADGYFNSNCTGEPNGHTTPPLVYAPPPANAGALCTQAAPNTGAFAYGVTAYVYMCLQP